MKTLIAFTLRLAVIFINRTVGDLGFSEANFAVYL